MMDGQTRLLVVNDDPTVRRVITRLVQPLGDEVIEADTGAEALRLIRETKPDLVLLDRVLPDIEGTEICRNIKTDSRLAHIFIVIVSASKVSGEQQADGLELGADDYIAWPMSHREFTARVKAMLRVRSAERQLRESREQYRQIVETALEGVWMVDPKGVTTFVNAQMATMLGYDAQEMLGKPILDFLAPESQEQARRQFSDCIAKFGRRQEVQFARKDGWVIWGLVSSTPLFDDDGQLRACLKMVTDITERKQAEEERERLIRELQESLAQVKQLSGLIPICMSCKKIRDDQGYWQNLESFLHEHSNVTFSHGLCVDCAKKLYPDYFDDELEEEQKKAR